MKFSLWMKFLTLTIHMEAMLYLAVHVLSHGAVYIIIHVHALCKIILTFVFVDKILKCDQLIKSF